MLMFLAGWKLAAISIAASLYRSQALVLSFRSLSFVLYITWCIVLYLDPIKVIIIPVFYIDSTSSLAQSLTQPMEVRVNSA